MKSMDMGRRSFLACVAGLFLDPERLLWVPGKNLISIPPPQRALLAESSCAAAIAAQLEYVRPQLEKLVVDAAAWRRLGGTRLISNRPSRVPLQFIAGGAFKTPP